MLCWNCLYLSFYFSGRLSDWFAAVSQVFAAHLFFLPRSPPDAGFSNRFVHFPADTHPSEAQTPLLSAFLN